LLLSRIIAPELAEDAAAGVYIVFSDELGANISRNLHGVTSPAIAGVPAVQAAIGNRFRGIGATMIINSRYTTPDNLPGVVIHELSHLVDTVALAAPQSRTSVTDQSFRSDLANHPAPAPQALLDDLAWHGAGFVRCCLHLRYRLALRGWPIDLHDIAKWDRYGIRDIRQYQRTLKSELRDRLTEPIRQIRRSPAPGQFLALYRHDQARFKAETKWQECLATTR